MNFVSDAVIWLFGTPITSYIVNQIPALRSIKISLKLDKTFNKALKKWTTNEFIYEKYKNQYKKYLPYLKNSYEGVICPDTSIKKFIDFWKEEIEEETDCVNYINGIKLDIIKESLNATKGQLAEIKVNTDDICQISSNLIFAILNIIPRFIEDLKYNSALSLVETLEKQFARTIDNDNMLKAEIFYLKAECLKFSRKDDSQTLYHKAFLTRPTDERFIEKELYLLLTKKKYDEVNSLIEKLDYMNVYKRFYTIALSENPKEEFDKADGTIKIYRNLYILILALLALGKDATFLFSNKDKTLIIPSKITNSNIEEWCYIISFYRNKIGSSIPLMWQWVSKENEEAFHIYNQFISCLEKTECNDKFKIVKALQCYSGFLVERKEEWINKFDVIDKSKIDEKDTLLLWESSMFFLNKNVEKAIDILEQLPSISAVNMLFKISHLSNSKRAAIIGIQNNKGKINSENAGLIGGIINKDNCNELETLFQQSSFETDFAKEILIQLCHLYEGCGVIIEDYSDEYDSEAELIRIYAAVLYLKTKKFEPAFYLIDNFSNEGLLFFISKFVFHLTTVKDFTPKLYLLCKEHFEELKDNILVLKFLINSSLKLLDFETAYKSCRLVYENNISNEAALVNYMIALGGYKPEELSLHKEEILSTNYTSKQNVCLVYNVLTENGLEETALILLDKNKHKFEDLKDLIWTESYSGALYGIANSTFQEVSENNTVIYEEDGIQKNIVASYRLQKSALFIGKHKGEEFIYEGKRIKVLEIRHRLFEENIETLKEIQEGGGSSSIHPLKITTDKPITEMEAFLEKCGHNGFMKEINDVYNQYLRGEKCIWNTISVNNLIEDFYEYLFSDKKSVLINHNTRIRKTFGHKYSLDLSCIFTLFEFHNITGYTLKDKFHISRTFYEFIKKLRKKSKLSIKFFAYNHALGLKKIKRFSDDIMLDYFERIKNLIEWLDKNCIVDTGEKTLSITQDNSETSFFATPIMILNPDYVFVSDEPFYYKKNLFINDLETSYNFMSEMTDEETAKLYLKFLLSCDNNELSIQ